MDIHEILSELHAERDRIDQAIAAIELLYSVSHRPTRRDGTGKPQAAPRKSGRRPMSAAARKKLSRLLKQRWAQGKMRARRKAA